MRPSSLGDDLVLHDEDVAGLEAESAWAKGGEQFVGEGVAGVDFVSEPNRDQAEFIARPGSGFFRPFAADLSWPVGLLIPS